MVIFTSLDSNPLEMEGREDYLSLCKILKAKPCFITLGEENNGVELNTEPKKKEKKNAEEKNVNLRRL